MHCFVQSGTLLYVSTKIYNAFRVSRPVDELFDFHRLVVSTIEKTYTDLYLSLAVSLAVATLDEAWLSARFPATSPTHPLSEIVPERPSPSPLLLRDTTRAMATLNSYVASSSRRLPGLDVSCELSYLVDDQDHSCFYLKVFSESKAYPEALAALALVQDFSYWDNTDHPRDLTPETWEHRAATWARLLPGAGVPAAVGLLYSTSYILSPSFAALFDHRDLSPYIPSRTSRAHSQDRAPETLPEVTSDDLYDPSSLLTRANDPLSRP